MRFLQTPEKTRRQAFFCDLVHEGPETPVNGRLESQLALLNIALRNF